ncbi:variant erythrocyte surface antigen-1 alpha subunit [Babesia bovis T2Bo]|nr:variant erythrocyte surface antigen-1 alpha subunit [Babesia bovis T2Bo]EDO07146.2 variant erythrocyte surface antigen-1 alpha subunit [Babesia bovis T2Bo]
MKWNVTDADKEHNGHHLGRGCQKCEGDKCTHSCYKKSYKSAYSNNNDSRKNDNIVTWEKLSTSSNRSKCARILLGSVCLIWSGLTYMYWTGKYAKGSPYWNNHILDGTGLDDGTLSQWLQALGFPRDMLNNAGPKNRLDKVIWDGLRDKFFLGFLEPKGLSDSGDVNDINGNTARAPFGMNYPGFVHTIHRDSFNTDQADVFPNGTSYSDTDTNQHKRGALFKLYILSCAYFTGLQKKTIPTTPNNPKTIREILYWLSALPYSQAYKDTLHYAKKRLEEVLKKPDECDTEQQQLKFYQDKRPHPITVDVFNLFAHFQAVTQYCPLVLIGIQGGLKGTDSSTEPPIHALYANTECHFTYPTVPIQAYNQVVHYIRALFYQLYFLRKQCAVKVALGGKWRECRYGSGVLGKGVISWMCLGCSPMEHDRKKRVEKVNGDLKTVLKGTSGDLPGALKELLQRIGEVVVQLGNAQEALEGKEKKAIQGVKRELEKAKGALDTAKGKLEKAKKALEKLTTNGGGGGILKNVVDAIGKAQSDVTNVDPGKNAISEGVHKIREVLKILKEEVPEAIDKAIDEMKQKGKDAYGTTRELLDWASKQFIHAIEQIKDICNSAKCSACDQHSKKCGQPSRFTQCPTCLQPTTTGVPSPLQAFLEDRLPGFSCEVVRNNDTDKDTVYPPAASHLGHCGGSGQCCPLPMGFRGQFQQGITQTGQRLYGILYFFSNENMMQSCVYTLVRVTAELSATTPQVLGDVFGFFRGGVGNKEEGETKSGQKKTCEHIKDPSNKGEDKYFCGWCASGLRDEVKKIEWIPKTGEAPYQDKVGKALIGIKGEKDSSATPTNTSLSTLTDSNHYVSPLTGELYTAVSATFGGTYLSWVLYLSDALEGGLKSLASAFQQIECRGCRECDPNKCKKGEHGQGSGQCGCQSIVSCTGVLPVLYRHGFSYGNPFNLEGYEQKDGSREGDYSITDTKNPRRCHQFLDSLAVVIDKNKQAASQQDQDNKHPLTELLSQVGQLQYDIRLPWIFVLTVAWLVAVLYLAFGAIWPLDWTHMRSHWLRGGEHQWQCMWYKVMTGVRRVPNVSSESTA